MSDPLLTDLLGWLAVGCVLGQLWCAARRRIEARQEGCGSDPDPMRIVEHRHVGHCTYEITTESRRHGRRTRRVLVLPGDAIEGGEHEG